MEPEPTFTAFADDVRVSSGTLRAVLLRAKAFVEDTSQSSPPTLLIFHDQTGRPVDVNLHGTPDQMLARELPPPEDPARAGPGRPRLGVVSREITLLPRHWDWLEQQRGGASAALRRLVEEAARRDPASQQARRSREVVGSVMGVLAGDKPGFEEALRALYAGDEPRFLAQIADWPADVRAYLGSLAGAAAG